MWKEAILTFMAFSQYMPSVSYAIFYAKRYYNLKLFV